LPRCLGSFRDYDTLDDKICRPCNNSFTQLEEQFCRSSPEAFFRQMLGIRGRKSHVTISPFLRGSAGTQPLVMKGKLPGEDFEILWQLNKGSKNIDYVTQIVLFIDERNTHIILIPDDMKDPAQLRERIKEAGQRLGVERFKEARIFAPESETERIKHLLSGLKFDSDVDWSRSPEKGKIETETVSTVTANYFRALAKIGFHYFLKQMPHFRGSEPAFANIRSFIKQGGLADVECFISLTSRQISSELTKGYRPENYCHLLLTGVNYHSFLTKLQFFLGPEYLPPVYLVYLGDNPSLIQHREAHTHAFVYYENGSQDGYDGYITEGTLN
jgi:hypothetical protein